MRIFIFSLKNLTRYKRRTLITAAALAFGIMCYTASDSLLAGANAETERNFRLYETGDSVIVDRAYWSERTLVNLTHTVEDASLISMQFAAQDIPSTPRVRTSAELLVYRDPFPEDGSLHVQLYGVDVATQQNVFDYHNVVTAGRWLAEGRAPEVVIGRWLAEDIGAEVGFPITVVTQTKKGFRQTIDATIVGILDCPNPVINRGAVIFSLDALDLFLQLEGSATEVALPPLNEAQREYVQQAVAQNGSLDIIPFTLLAEEFFVLAESESSGNRVMLFVIFIIAAVGVSNTMLMAVLERSREVGMLRALGMTSRQIHAMFLYEAVGIGIIGGTLGVLLGVLLNIPLVWFGIDYGALLRDFDFGYRLTSVFRGTWRAQTFLGAFVIAICVTVLTAYFPIRRTLKRRSITENLRAH